MRPADPSGGIDTSPNPPGDCRNIAELLHSKASEQEADEYKQWAMIVAENVAKAAKEGGFLGFGGEQISAEEKELFRQLGAALGVPGRLA